MEIARQIRLGSTLVTVQDRRRVIFQDVYDSMGQPTVELVDLAELIQFLGELVPFTSESPRDDRNDSTTPCPLEPADWHGIETGNPSPSQTSTT